MSQKSLHLPQVESSSISCSDFDDYESFKDLYLPRGAARQFCEIKSPFESAGYDIRLAELLPHGFPVVVLNLTRTTAPAFSDQKQFHQHILEILQRVKIWIDEADVMAKQTANRVLVSFIWEPPAFDSIEAMELPELLALLP